MLLTGRAILVRIHTVRHRSARLCWPVLGDDWDEGDHDAATTPVPRDNSHGRQRGWSRWRKPVIGYSQHAVGHCSAADDTDLHALSTKTASRQQLVTSSIDIIASLLHCTMQNFLEYLKFTRWSCIGWMLYIGWMLLIIILRLGHFIASLHCAQIDGRRQMSRSRSPSQLFFIFFPFFFYSIKL